MTVRWGILGAGWIVQTATADALRHAPSATLAGVAARDINRARALEPEHAYGSYGDLLADDSIDAVYIALTNDQHFPWILNAIAAGKHVLCEKPLTLSAHQTSEVFTAAEKAGVLLVEAAWSMWHPRMRRLTELVSSGAIGTITDFLGTFTFEGVPEGNYRLDPTLGGGALLDIGVYPLHALVGCLPEVRSMRPEVERISSESGVDLTTKARLDLGSRGSASIVASFTMPESQRLLVHGADTEVRVPDDQAFTTWREATTLIVGEHLEEFAPTNAYQDMFQAVSARIMGREEWILPPDSSIRVASLVDALR